MQGINLIRQHKIYIESGSINLIKEFKNYKWKKDKDGEVIPNSWIESISNDMGLTTNYRYDHGQWGVVLYDDLGRDYYYASSYGTICTWEWALMDDTIVSRSSYNHLTHTDENLPGQPISTFEHVLMGQMEIDTPYD